VPSTLTRRRRSCRHGMQLREAGRFAPRPRSGRLAPGYATFPHSGLDHPASSATQRGLHHQRTRPCACSPQQGCREPGATRPARAAGGWPLSRRLARAAGPPCPRSGSTSEQARPCSAPRPRSDSATADSTIQQPPPPSGLRHPAGAQQPSSYHRPADSTPRLLTATGLSRAGRYAPRPRSGRLAHSRRLALVAGPCPRSRLHHPAGGTMQCAPPAQRAPAQRQPCRTVTSRA
jgi:hypothetical protein